MKSKASADRQRKQGDGRKGARTLGEKHARRLLAKARRGRVNIVVDEVDNPYFNPAHKESQSNPRRIRSPRNANESPLVLMESRGTINRAQAEAGLRFRHLFERTMAGQPSPSDIKERVDGGVQRRKSGFGAPAFSIFSRQPLIHCLGTQLEDLR